MDQQEGLGNLKDSLYILEDGTAALHSRTHPYLPAEVGRQSGQQSVHVPTLAILGGEAIAGIAVAQVVARPR